MERRPELGVSTKRTGAVSGPRRQAMLDGCWEQSLMAEKLEAPSTRCRGLSIGVVESRTRGRGCGSEKHRWNEAFVVVPLHVR